MPPRLAYKLIPDVHAVSIAKLNASIVPIKWLLFRPSIGPLSTLTFGYEQLLLFLLDSGVRTSATETRCSALKPDVGSRNTQVVSTNGAVSAGMPIGDSATAMAANTIALKIVPINA